MKMTQEEKMAIELNDFKEKQNLILKRLFKIEQILEGEAQARIQVKEFNQNAKPLSMEPSSYMSNRQKRLDEMGV